MLLAPDKERRIIAIKSEVVTVVEMNTTRIIVEHFSVNEVGTHIVNHEWSVIAFEKVNIKLEEHMSEKTMKYTAVVKEAMEYFSDEMANFNKKGSDEFVQNLCKKYDVSKATFWRVLRRYLQSGLDQRQLFDRRVLGNSKGKEYTYSTKPGRPSNHSVTEGKLLNENDFKAFDKAIRDYKNRIKTTLIGAFRTYKDVGTWVTVVKDNKAYAHLDIPSPRQFYYYANKRLSAEEKLAANTTDRDMRNNHRILTSDNVYEVYGPGDLFEVDEQEFDVRLVSERDRSIEIGKPVLYLMIDVFTRKIMGYSVGFDNNSVNGIKNCFLNLMEDKVALCAKYGFAISPDLWPSGFLPARLRSDYGSEYLSKEMFRMCAELGISHELVSPATGSLKGLVEGTFHSSAAPTKGLYEKRGLITGIAGDDPHAGACLTMHEFEKIIISTIIMHNTMFWENYPLNHKMREAGVIATSTGLWKYGVSHFGEPKKINPVAFRFSLLEPIKMSVTQKGITYKGLTYLDDSPWLTDLIFSSASKVEVRFDRRDITRIYVMRDHTLHTIPLNTKRTDLASLSGSFEEYMANRKAILRTNADARVLNEAIKTEAVHKANEIITSAEKQKIPKKTGLDLIQTRAEAAKIRRQEQLVIPHEENPVENTVATSEALNGATNEIPMVLESYRNEEELLKNSLAIYEELGGENYED